jgi:hypothetical protein
MLTLRRFSLASLATATLGPSHDSLAEWAANVSRRDNPISDFLFEFEFEKPIQKEPAQKKPTQKKSTQKKTAQKKTKTK